MVLQQDHTLKNPKRIKRIKNNVYGGQCPHKPISIILTFHIDIINMNKKQKRNSIKRFNSSSYSKGVML